MSSLLYNYVFFNSADNNRRKDNDGYYTICTKDLETMDGVEVVSLPLENAPGWVRALFSLHNSWAINRKIPLPFRKLWYPFYFRDRFPEKKPYCFVVSGWYITPEYIRYLKKKYPGCKVVKLYRDLVHVWRDQFPEFSDAVMQECFDLQMTFDEGQGKEYGFPYFMEFESKIDVPVAKDYPLSDVFFAGKAKDRLPRLLQIYQKLTEAGYKCSYYLTGVPEEDRIPLAGVEYADSPMSYREMLYRTVNSRCVLDVNQQGAVGFTSRFLEAVMFNKRLLTDNLSIRSSSFFNEQYIHCFTAADEIDTAFVNAKEPVDYANEFSPVHLIYQIDQELSSDMRG